LAFVSVYSGHAGVLDASTAGYNVSVSLPDSIYEKFGVHRDGAYEFGRDFCIGPGTEVQWVSGDSPALYVQVFSPSRGWLDFVRIDTRSTLLGHYNFYPDGGTFTVHFPTGSDIAFDQTVEFRIINKLSPPVPLFLGGSLGPANSSWAGLTLTFGDQCPAPPAPPPEPQTFPMVSRDLFHPYGAAAIFTLGVISTLPSGARGRVIIV
jgi:hypothetical protein